MIWADNLRFDVDIIQALDKGAWMKGYGGERATNVDKQEAASCRARHLETLANKCW